MRKLPPIRLFRLCSALRILSSVLAKNIPQAVQDEIRRASIGGLHGSGDEAGGIESDEESGVCAPVLMGRICRRRWQLEWLNAKAQRYIKDYRRSFMYQLRLCVESRSHNKLNLNRNNKLWDTKINHGFSQMRRMNADLIREYL
jgi:hypothetical protein